MIVLSDDLVERCRLDGERFVRDHAAGKVSARSTFFGTNAKRQAIAKAAECIAAIYYGVSVEQPFENAGKDYDIVLGRARIDVKSITSLGEKRTLIWQPREEETLEEMEARYDRGEFDALCLVWTDGRQGDVMRWITKGRFRKHKQVADGSGDWLLNTWFMPASWLNPRDMLRGYLGKCHCGRAATVYGCKGDSDGVAAAKRIYPECDRWCCVFHQPDASFMASRRYA